MIDPTPQLPLTRTPPAAPTRPGAPVSLEVVRALLRGLNREQRRAVTHGDGPLLVLAGPGTGKTEVITRRIAWLIATKRARPSEILALTFTDKAADAMQARVDVLVPYGQADAAIHTFHAFGDRLVRDHAFELGLPSDPRVITRADAVLLLREHLFELGLDRYRPLGDPTRFLSALVDHFGRAKEEGIGPERYADHAASLLRDVGGTDDDAVARAAEAAARAEIATAYARYQALLAERGLIDFGDQIALAVRLLREHPLVRREVRERFRYVLVDEFQDTDPLQLELLELAAGPDRNVTVVGDDDQSIYTFRGAAISNILGFAGRFVGATTVVLRRNYRSRAPILEASRRLITHNDPHRLEARAGVDKRLIAHRRGKPLPVRHLVHRTEDDEADAVAEEIARRVAGGERPSDFAVLVRTNGDADRYVRSLTAAGVPARSGGTGGLYGRPAIRELLAFLRVVADPESTVDLYALATAEPYGLGGTDLTALLEHARRRHRPLWSVMCELERQPGLVPLPDAVRRTVARLVADVRASSELAHRRSTGEVLYDHLKRSGRLARLAAAQHAGDEEALQDVARFFGIIRSRAQLLTEDRIAFFVRHLQSLVDAGDDPAAASDVPDVDAVPVLTVHKAKGLEFRVVFLVGLVEGRFPNRGRREVLTLPVELLRRRPEETVEADWAEERRLCYVAMTRARDELVLSHAAEGYGRRARRPSIFVAEALDQPGGATVPLRDAAPSPLEALARFEAAADAVAVPIAPRGADHLTLSFSQLDDYLTCPLKYKLRHVVGVPTPPHHALVLGNALHQAVAAFHTRRGRGHVMSEDELIAEFAAHWSSEGFLSRAHEDARYGAGREALRRFRAAELAGPAPLPTAVERPFTFAIDGDTVRGRFDRVDSGPDGTVITDYKSSDVRDPKKAAEKARGSLQLQIYALAHEAETGSPPAAVELHFLESGVVGRAVPDRPRLDRARDSVRRAADGIRRGDFAARPDYLACSYCPYRDICPSTTA